ncbi:ABC transporter permease [Arthrobacter mobilis]|uniref:ABC transporter permease subunit n=1 Tax=Arthrobacter mobilis TaxID=2724944 RepID=A0A7X6K6M5_9MICC|nr:ABC transporter permease [Arthrobacter mobilis]NKX55610.1 ABC transporter permease subunit [Arthrobacter mobilis]
MSTTALQSPRTGMKAARPAGGVNFLRALHAEWIKFTTLRSTWILLATTLAAMVGIGLLGAWGVATALEQAADSGRDPGADGVRPQLLYLMPTGGIDFAQLIIGSLGVLLIASEYSTGMIRSTMTAVPDRLSPLFAKALVIAAVAAVTGIVSSFATYFLMQPVLAGYGQEFGLEVENLVPSMLLSGAYLALASLTALALGSLLRNSAGGIVTLVALFLVLPTVLGLIQLDWIQDALPYLPSNAGRQLLALEIAGGDLTRLQGGLVMAAWSAVLLAAAAVVTKVRDV